MHFVSVRFVTVIRNNSLGGMYVAHNVADVTNTLEANTTNSTTCSVLVTYVIQCKRGLHVLLGGCIQSSEDGYCNVIVNLFFRVLQK